MEDIHRTHKEPAWGWIGALLDAHRLSRRETGDVRSFDRGVHPAKAELGIIALLEQHGTRRDTVQDGIREQILPPLG